MKNVFKKSLLAVAIAGIHGTAIAADATAPASPTAVTYEYLEVNTGSAITSQSIGITLQDEYAADDFIMLSFPGSDVIDATSLPSIVTVSGSTTYDTTCNDALANTTATPTAGGSLYAVYNGANPDASKCEIYDEAGTPGDTQDDTIVDTGYPDVLSEQKGMTIDFITTGYDASGDFTWAKYRITELTGSSSASTVGTVIDFGAADFDADLLADYEEYSFSTFSRTRYDNYPDAEGSTPDPLDESEDNSAVLFSMSNQFALTTGETFDQVIDVTTEDEADFRRVFVTGVSDEARMALTNDTSGLSATLRGTEFVVSGDNMFGWVEDDDDTTAGIQLAGGSTEITFNTGACSVADLTVDELTIQCDETFTAGSLWVYLQPDAVAKNILNDGPFTLTGEVEYAASLGATETFTSSFDDLDFGAWTINGSETVIPYMPYSAQTMSNQSGLPIDQIIYVTNSSSRSYDAGSEPRVYVTVMAEDGTSTELTNSDLGGVRINHGITKLTGQIREAMFQKGLLTSSQKFSLEITVEEAGSNIEVYSAYNVGGDDRGWVQNDSHRVYQNNIN
ncbi:hypothetical protein [Pseudidiomarina sp. CB1]|uniref:hypothetical protein n=1 Tax=Pseudidiomarina sp. CB1 TaxID=2972484 RepID=UPI0021616197|nr:hypothetical protein [Pseudidiomarina sp. CB1]